jgi:hypothetical protein
MDTTTQLEIASQAYWDKRNAANPQDIWSSTSPYLHALFGRKSLKAGLVKESELVPGGSAIREYFETGPTNCGPFGPKSEFATEEVTIVDSASFDWGGANASYSIGLAEKRANFGAGKIVDLGLRKIENGRKSIQHAMAIMVYLSRANCQAYVAANWTNQDTDLSAAFDGAQAMFGINTGSAHPHAALANTVTYGGVSESVVSTWKPNFDIEAHKISDDFLMTAEAAANPSGDPDETPDYYFMDTVLLRSMRSQLFNLMRLPPPQNEYMAKVGYKTVVWNGAALVYDPYIVKALTTSAGSAAYAKMFLFGINSRFLSLRTHPEFAFKRIPWEHKAMSGGNKEVGGIIYQGAITTRHRTAAGCCYSNVSPAD